ncbi:CLUMA_CG010839, isoform A [Clunio marinus]|uniref:CLUMA_CG010839, isoform A n=1 Tax=Clunio marinus TaxID=568069 RepID=A0A1J1ICG8_9DIPT|nr:CLUMA_CG010839, isoform A [Clunio marinus]
MNCKIHPTFFYPIIKHYIGFKNEKNSTKEFYFLSLPKSVHNAYQHRRKISLLKVSLLMRYSIVASTVVDSEVWRYRDWTKDVDK